MTQLKDHGFTDQYMKDIIENPFSDTREELDAWLSYVDLLCKVMAERTSSKNDMPAARVGHKPPAGEALKTLLISESEDEDLSSGLRDIFDLLLERGSDTPEGIAAPLWDLFRSTLMDDCERMVFMIALSVDLNRKYEKIFDMLSGDGSGTGRPTIGLALDLCRLFMSKKECSVTKLLNDGSILRSLLTQRRAYSGSLMGEELRIRKSIIMLLMGKEDNIAGASGIVHFLNSLPDEEKVLRVDVLNDLKKISSSETRNVCHLRAASGYGRRFLLQRLAGENDLGVISIHLPMLFTKDESEAEDILKETAIKHLLFGDIIYLEAGDIKKIDPTRLQNAFRILQPYVYDLYIGGEGSIPEDIRIDGQRFVINVKRPTRGEQEILWRELAGRHDIEFAPDVSVSELASKFNLTPGQIERALTVSASLSKGGDGRTKLSHEEIEEQLRNLSGEKLSHLSRKMNATFGLEDIQLRKEALTQVEDLLNRIRFRSVVNDEFGFSRKLPYGRGVSVVLYGPPGTGKTMLACVIAKELGLDLYRVDTSAIGSKYIGETEKNIGALFEAAMGSNGILFFDEADALFSKRTDVENANDKHANSEVAFLLQQIEEYDGLSILATNAVQTFDAAFKRRMTYFIPVEKPDEEERLQIWQNVFPKDTPLKDDISFELYAKVEGMTGSTIKAAAVTAAYYAASRGEAVSNADIIEAIDIEYKKAGNMSGIRESLYSGMI